MQDLISSEIKKIRVEFQDWGTIDYQEAWDKQEALFSEIVNIKSANRTNNTEIITKNYLIFCSVLFISSVFSQEKESNLLFPIQKTLE